jgi:hypothetical protein
VRKDGVALVLPRQPEGVRDRRGRRRAAAAGGEQQVVRDLGARPPRRFRKRGTEYLSDSGLNRMSSGAETVWPSPERDRVRGKADRVELAEGAGLGGGGGEARRRPARHLGAALYASQQRPRGLANGFGVAC